MTMLTRDQILKAEDLKTETVPVPEWGGDVNVRTLTGTERDAFEEGCIKGKGKRDLSNLRARLCALAIVDENSNRMFSDRDVHILGKKSAAALDRVFTVAQRLSGVTDADVDDLAKNSETGQSEDSISD